VILVWSWPPSVESMYPLLTDLLNVVPSNCYLLTYLLTYSMQQSPSWEANWFSVSQIPHILWNPKVHYRSHKCPPPVPIVSQLDPLHAPTSHFLKIHLCCKWACPVQAADIPRTESHVPININFALPVHCVSLS